MADLIIPAVIRWWLGFLLFFVLLGYAVPFSIWFSAIGGLAGGVATGWWQAKGGAPAPRNRTSAPSPSSRAARDSNQKRGLFSLPQSKARDRYRERIRKAKERRLK